MPVLTWQMPLSLPRLRVRIHQPGLNAEKDILDTPYTVRAVSRFTPSLLVGLRRYDPHRFRRMVACLLQRLVLSAFECIFATACFP